MNLSKKQRPILRNLALSLLTCGLILGSSVYTFADQSAVDQQAHEVFGQVMSPFCPGRLLNDCPSSKATDLKNDIRKQLASGQSPNQIFESLIATYGDEVRAAPAQEGIGRMAWYAPFIFLILGFALISLWLRGRAGSKEPTQLTKQLDPEMQAKIEAELRRG